MGRKRPLSLGTVMVLHALARGRQYGFDIMEDTGLASGTIYPALDKLERLAFARSEWEDPGTAQAQKRPPRRYYTITARGTEALLEVLERYRQLAPLDASAIASSSRSR